MHMHVIHLHIIIHTHTCSHNRCRALVTCQEHKGWHKGPPYSNTFIQIHTYIHTQCQGRVTGQNHRGRQHDRHRRHSCPSVRCRNKKLLLGMCHVFQHVCTCAFRAYTFCARPLCTYACGAYAVYVCAFLCVRFACMRTPACSCVNVTGVSLRKLSSFRHAFSCLFHAHMCMSHMYVWWRHTVKITTYVRAHTCMRHIAFGQRVKAPLSSLFSLSINVDFIWYQYFLWSQYFFWY
jgi:hypothetical protein